MQSRTTVDHTSWGGRMSTRTTNSPRHLSQTTESCCCCSLCRQEFRIRLEDCNHLSQREDFWNSRTGVEVLIRLRRCGRVRITESFTFGDSGRDVVSAFVLVSGVFPLGMELEILHSVSVDRPIPICRTRRIASTAPERSRTLSFGALPTVSGSEKISMRIRMLFADCRRFLSSAALEQRQS